MDKCKERVDKYMNDLALDDSPYNGLGLGIYHLGHPSQEILQSGDRANNRQLKQIMEVEQTGERSQGLQKIQPFHEVVFDILEDKKGRAKILADYDPSANELIHRVALDFKKRFLETRDLHPLNEAISQLHHAVLSTPEDHRSRHTYLGSLASVLIQRFHETGDINDINKAIQYRSDALETLEFTHDGVPKTKDSQFLPYLSAIADAFLTRYNMTYEMSDLSEAFELFKFASSISKNQGSQHVAVLQGLANVYRNQFVRTRESDKLRKAYHSIQEAMNMSSIDHRRSNLSLILTVMTISEERFKERGQIRSLDQAIDHGKRALRAGHEDLHLEMEVLVQLGLLFQRRSEKSHSQADLERGVQYACLAAQMVTEYSPSRSICLYHMGIGYKRQYERSTVQGELELAVDAFQKSFAIQNGTPFYRLLAGVQAVGILVHEENWADATYMLEQIVGFLPTLSSRLATRQDLQFQLQPLSGIPALLASVFLKAGKHPSIALETLEQCRGVTSSQMMDIKFENLELLERYPVYWKAYSQLQERVFVGKQQEGRFETTPGVVPNYTGAAVRSRSMRNTCERLSRVISNIRKLTGFERFLLPLTRDEIQNLSRDGPIVCLNASRTSSEAFLITETGIDAISLKLRLEDVRMCIKLFASEGNAARRDATICEDDDDDDERLDDEVGFKDLCAHMASLWDAAVCPVLQKLGFYPPLSNSKLPRVWWVGNGLTSLLPLHAAGRHHPLSTENTISNVISSYASTLKSLALLRLKKPFTLEGKGAEVLVVSMPTSPGHPPLRVSGEVEAIKRHTASWASNVVLERVAKRRVLTALQSCTVAHFACHGVLDPIDPAQSALIIGREAEERLTVNDLDDLSYTQSKIAYLSACSTAEISLKSMTDESVNVASNFQLAGFKHVIGTLWGADDDAAAEIASHFYPGLLRYKDRADASVAQALHDAVVEYRNLEGNMKQVSKWAPFIHLGC